MRTKILWRVATQPSPSGFLQHRFELVGPEAIIIQAWITQDNKDHGEWRLTPWGSGKVEIWADCKNTASVQQVRSRIARLKAAWRAPEHLVDWVVQSQAEEAEPLAVTEATAPTRPRGCPALL